MVWHVKSCNACTPTKDSPVHDNAMNSQEQIPTWIKRTRMALDERPSLCSRSFFRTVGQNLEEWGCQREEEFKDAELHVVTRMQDGICCRVVEGGRMVKKCYRIGTGVLLTAYYVI